MDIHSTINFRYPGTRPFDDNDIERNLFFGRDQEKHDLLHKVLANNLVVLYSKSGIGKTSLIHAGLNQALRDRGFIPLIIRFNLPQYDPCSIIYRSIDDIAATKKLDFEEGEKSFLWQYFKTAMFWSENNTLLKPVLIFDQFEEFFDVHSLEARKEFISQIADIVNNRIPDAIRKSIQVGESFQYYEKPLNVKIIISLREEFLGQLEEMSREIPDIFNNRFKLFPLTCEQAEVAISQPAQLKDGAIQSEPFEYSPDAVKMMLDFLCKRNEKDGIHFSNEVESFQLQLICRYIEDKVRERTGKKNVPVVIKQEDLGGEKGMQQILQKFYSDCLNRLDSFQEKRRTRKLCQKGLISFANRRLSLEVNEIERNYDVSKNLLTKLVDYRIVRSEPRLGSVYYELSHDSLISPIRATQKKPQAALVKYTLLILVPIILVVMAIVTAGILKQNKLDNRLTAARQFIRDSKHAEALNIYKKIIDEDPKQAWTYKEIRDDLKKYNENETLDKLYKMAFGVKIKDADYYLMLGIDYYELKNYDASTACYQKALELKPDNAFAYYNLGNAQFNKGNYNDALVSYNTARQLKPDFAVVYNNIGYIQSIQGKFEDALINYNKAVQLKPDLAQAYNNIGNLQSEKEYEAALTSYRKALEIKPDYVLAYINMGIIQFKNNEYTAAMENFQKALKLKPDDFLVNANMAVLYLITEQFDKAIELAIHASKDKSVRPYQILATKSIVICSLFLQSNKTQGLMELRQLITYYRSLAIDDRKNWRYEKMREFISQTQRLDKSTQALLLKMFDLLEVSREKGKGILGSLEKMVQEFE